MRLVFTSDVGEFIRAAGPLIDPQLECNVMASVARNIQDGFYAESEAAMAYGVDAQGKVCFAGIRTPPRNMLASELDPAHASELMSEWLQIDPGLPGVNASPDTARGIAAAWRSQTGGTTGCQMRQLLHVLTEVQEPERPASGELRLPEESEHEMLAAWATAFGREVGLEDEAHVRTLLATRLDHDGLLLWDDGGPVSMVGLAAPVAGVARVAPVYTPPSCRGHGYATNAVAELSRRALAAGAHTCMLYTDPDNPTSNKIYAEVGYRLVGEVEEHAFDPQTTRES